MVSIYVVCLSAPAEIISFDNTSVGGQIFLSAVRCVLFVNNNAIFYNRIGLHLLRVAPTELILGLVGVSLQTVYPYGVIFERKISM